MAIVLSRTGQIIRKIESVVGTAETLTSAEAQGNFKAQGHTYTPGEYERDLQRTSLSKDPAVKGTRAGVIKFTEELVGGAAATAAPWHTDLIGMGFAYSTALKFVNVGSITGDRFNCGDVIGNNAVQGSATKTAMVVGQYTVSSVNKIVYIQLTGSAIASSDVLTDYTNTGTSATASSSAAAAGYSLVPVTESESVTPSSLTMERRHGGQRHTLTGARGKGSLTMKMNEPALLNCEFQGPPVLDATTGRPTSASAITGITEVGAAPLACKGQRIRIGTYAPILTDVTIEIDNTLAPRGTIADNDFNSSGYQDTRISDRKISMTLDPEFTVSTSEIDQYGRSMIGSTFKFVAEAGTPTHTNGAVVAYGPVAQLMGDAQEGDRDGIKTSPLSVQFRRSTADDELQIFHVFL